MKTVALLLLLASIKLFSADYSTMSNEDFFSQRGSVTTENRDAYRTEMQSRMQSLSPEERSTYRSGNGSGQGTQTQQRLRDGSGSGGMYRGSRGGGGRGR